MRVGSARSTRRRGPTTVTRQVSAPEATLMPVASFATCSGPSVEQINHAQARSRGMRPAALLIGSPAAGAHTARPWRHLWKARRGTGRPVQYKQNPPNRDGTFTTPNEAERDRRGPSPVVTGPGASRKASGEHGHRPADPAPRGAGTAPRRDRPRATAGDTRSGRRRAPADAHLPADAGDDVRHGRDDVGYRLGGAALGGRRRTRPRHGRHGTGP